MEYLMYLRDYWSRPDKKQYVSEHLGEGEDHLSEVVLASYNSGATRVFQAIEKRGKKWLEDRELKAARRYVRRVVSYCDFFSQGDEP